MATLKISDLSVGDWVEFHRTRGIYITPPLFDHANAQVIGTHRGAEVSLLVDGKREFIAIPLSAIRPIPITPEILEKNGLYRHEIDEDNPRQVVLSNRLMMARTYDGVEWWRVLIYDEEIQSKELFNGIVYSVHQLQHALRLAGVDKEINL